MNKIFANKIKCKNCGDIIESRYTHEYVTCSCGQCSVDGGKDYMKRNFRGNSPEECYEELSEYKKIEGVI